MESQRLLSVVPEGKGRTALNHYSLTTVFATLKKVAQCILPLQQPPVPWQGNDVQDNLKIYVSHTLNF